MRRILCLDFDGVIHSYRSGWKGARCIPDLPTDGAIDFLWNALTEGWDVRIHSSRARYFGGIRAMRRWLRLHSGNLWHETFGHNGLKSIRFCRWKPSAFVTIDDRAITFDGSWPSVVQLREFRPWNSFAKVSSYMGAVSWDQLLCELTFLRAAGWLPYVLTHERQPPVENRKEIRRMTVQFAPPVEGREIGLEEA